MSVVNTTLEQIQLSLEKVLTKSVKLESTTLLRKDLGVQSIDIIDLVFVLEKQFGIRLELEDFFQLPSKSPGGGTGDIVVSDLIDYIESIRKPDEPV